MKREQFSISSTVGHRVIKNAWNSSLREIERLVRELAKEASTTYQLCGSESHKNGFNYVSGSRTWENQRNGGQVVFTIQKIDSPATGQAHK